MISYSKVASSSLVKVKAMIFTFDFSSRSKFPYRAGATGVYVHPIPRVPVTVYNTTVLL